MIIRDHNSSKRQRWSSAHYLTVLDLDLRTLTEGKRKAGQGRGCLGVEECAKVTDNSLPLLDPAQDVVPLFSAYEYLPADLPLLQNQQTFELVFKFTKGAGLTVRLINYAS